MTVLDPQRTDVRHRAAAAPWPPADPRHDTAYPGQPRPRGAALRPAQRWAEPVAAAALAVGTAVLYLWGLGASGWANSFYAAAVQAGSRSWTAMFFGSFDAANFITVDKPPASLWLMDLSARLFGLSSWSMLVPEALCGVTTVVLLYRTVRRWFGPAAGLLAGAALALTPVATLMFRFNNPDALLVLLLVAGGYALTRALERASTRWLLLCAALVGTAFLTKMLQAYLVVPGFAAAWLLAAPSGLRRRLGQLCAAGGVLLLSSGWWIAAVQLTPAADRPYIGGSQNNSVLNLLFGYNGFGRLTGNETGSVGGGGGSTSRWGATGLFRLFNSQFGGQASWLLPTALLAGAAGLALRGRAPRTDRTRAALVIWGGWTLVTGVTFSFASGIIHPYYTVALAPGIAATAAIGAVTLWRHRTRWGARVALLATLAVSAGWAVTLLARTPRYAPALRPLVVLAAVIAGALLLLPRRGSLAAAGDQPWPEGTSRTPGGVPAGTVARPRRWTRRVGAAAVGAATVSVLAGPAAFALSTAAAPHTGALPLAGPASAGGFGPGGAGGPGGAPPGTPPGAPPAGFLPPGGLPAGAPPAGTAGTPGSPAGAAGSAPGSAPASAPGSAVGAGGTVAPGLPGGAAGGLLSSSAVSSATASALRSSGAGYRWVLATVGANRAAGYQLATGRPVMALGGFNGTDPTPTLAAFEHLVATGQVRYFLAGGGMPGGAAGGGTASSVTATIATWVAAHFTTTTVGDLTVYDLAPGGSAASHAA